VKHKVKQALPNLIVFLLSKTQPHTQNLPNFGGFQSLCNRSLYNNLDRTRHTDPKGEHFRVPKQQLGTDLAIPLWFSWPNQVLEGTLVLRDFTWFLMLGNLLFTSENRPIVEADFVRLMGTRLTLPGMPSDHRPCIISHQGP
jgi:hypothetical protein